MKRGKRKEGTKLAAVQCLGMGRRAYDGFLGGFWWYILKIYTRKPTPSHGQDVHDG